MTHADLFHYTFAHKLKAILGERLLVPSGHVDKERKVLWFSRRQDHEPTAVKMVMQGGVPVRPSFEQLAAQVPPVRFRLLVPPEAVGLLPWRAICKAAGIPQRSLEYMVRAGVQLGASPADWFGTLQSIPLEKTQAEVYLEKTWIVADIDRLNDLAESQSRVLSAGPKEMGLKVA